MSALETKREYDAARYAANREAIKARCAQYVRANPERDRLRHAIYRASNPSKIKAAARNYYSLNKKTVNERACAWAKNNPEKHRLNGKLWKKRNPDRFRELCRKAYRNNPNSRLRCVLSARLSKLIRGLTKKQQSTERLIGCTVSALRTHIESQWKPGMSWDNHSFEGWHIDHIRPCSSFNLTDPEQQRSCFHWTNLQPLWKDENLKKSNQFNPRKTQQQHESTRE